MNRICPTILAAVALSGCGGPNYTLSGRAGLAPGDTLRLCSPYENDSVLATTVIRRDSSFRIRGHVSEPTIANLMHNDRRIGAPILLEAADIRLEPTGDVRGFQFTGTPLNDAFNAMNAAQVSLGNVLQALENEPDTPERRRKLDSLGRIYRQIPGDALEANRDNLLGAFLYARRTDADPAKARERLAQFPAQLQNHPVLASVRREIEAVERSSVGRPYMDLTLKDADGETVALSSLAGPGRWVLLDFWATWCGPCCREIPYLKEAYAAFSGRGFAIYAVSIDHDAARWQRFLAENDLPWTNVLSSGCGKQSPAAAMYGIRFIVEFPDLARRRDRRPQPSRQAIAVPAGGIDEIASFFKRLIIRTMAQHPSSGSSFLLNFLSNYLRVSDFCPTFAFAIRHRSLIE